MRAVRTLGSPFVGVLLAVLALGGLAVREIDRAAARTPALGVHVVRAHSAALRGTEHYEVYLPPDYGRSTRRYPVVYLLHGLPASAHSFEHPRVARLGQIAAARGRPAIVVSPQGARRGDRDPEWHDWGAGRNWETAVARDATADVDRRFRTIADRRARAIIGISGGGYGAMLIGLHHLDTYAAIESWSGYFHPTNPRGDAPLDVGDEHADAKADAHRFVRCMGRLSPHERPALLGFFVGDRDRLFVAENVRLHRALRAAGVPHVFRVYHGGHSDSVWGPHQEQWLMMVLRRLASAPPPRERHPTDRRRAERRAGCPID